MNSTEFDVVLFPASLADRRGLAVARRRAIAGWPSFELLGLLAFALLALQL